MVYVAGTKIHNAISETTSRHYLNSPGYANSVVHELQGEIKALSAITEDDPLLYAYAINDRIKRIAGLVVKLSKWCNAVIESTPDELFETGAQTCH